MDDFVKRLRAPIAPFQSARSIEGVLKIAADEIERLRSALNEMAELTTTNREAWMILAAIRKCAQHALNIHQREGSDG
jgi:hypothetical protein